jgi:hypothetical protein
MPPGVVCPLQILPASSSEACTGPARPLKQPRYSMRLAALGSGVRASASEDSVSDSRCNATAPHQRHARVREGGIHRKSGKTVAPERRSRLKKCTYPEAYGYASGPYEQCAELRVPDSLFAGLAGGGNCERRSYQRDVCLSAGARPAKLSYRIQVHSAEPAGEDTRCTCGVDLIDFLRSDASPPNKDRNRPKPCVRVHNRDEVETGQNRQPERDDQEVRQIWTRKLPQDVKGDRRGLCVP